MEETKTGVIVCKRFDPRNQFAYEPVAFITGVPADFHDEDLKQNIDPVSMASVIVNCQEVLFRADIRATSNEIQEVFDHLHEDGGAVPTIPFRQKSFAI